VSFLKGSLSFVRFRTDLPRPRVFGELHLDALRAHAAGKQRVAAADGVEVGWAAGESVLDVEFGESKNVWPDHFLFDFWTLSDKLPPDLLTAYYVADLRAISRDNPSGFPSSRQKREAKESARERLEQEAADGRFKKRKCVPVAWDAARSEVLFGSTSAAAQLRFLKLFEETFGGRLTPITAGELAARINPRAADEALSLFVKGITPDDAAWVPAGADFLGNEFLLWLWYVADCTGTDTLALPDGSEVVFMFSGGVKVEDPRGQTGHGTMNSESAVRLPEARAAVRAGKLPRKAALTLVRHDDQFSVILQAETLAVTSGKVPNAPGDVNGRAREEHRLQAVRDLCETLDQVYAAFLGLRLSKAWELELAEVRAWLGSAKVGA